jgi:hypothetical protein
MSLFDQTDLVEIAHPDSASERLIACFNPLLAEERARKRLSYGLPPRGNWRKLPRLPGARAPTARQTEYRRADGQDSHRYKMGKHLQPTQNSQHRTRQSLGGASFPQFEERRPTTYARATMVCPIAFALLFYFAC